jgi:hypothetical protein
MSGGPTNATTITRTARPNATVRTDARSSLLSRNR